MKTLRDELDWVVKVVVLACAAHFATIAVAMAEWNKGTDGYYYKDGDTTYPYERYEKTCYKTEKVWYATGCCGAGYWSTTQKPYKCYDYRRVVVVDPEQGIERVAKQMLGIVEGNARSERKLRETKAFENSVASLAQTLGIDNIRLPESQSITYGDLDYYRQEYQYPPQTGNTQYGTRTYESESYGSSIQTLQPLVADLRAMQVEEHELEKLREEHYQERVLKRGEFNAEFRDSAGAIAGATAQQQESNRLALGLMEYATRLVEASKPAPQASVRITEKVPYRAEVAPQITAGGWRAVVENSCHECHDKHVAVKSATFPDGVHLDEMAAWDIGQIKKCIADIETDRMPKNDAKLDVHDKGSLLAYLITLKVAKE